jgi:hypothetical protein
MSSKTKLQAIYRLSNLADAGADHPEAISYGPGRDYFDHRMILSAISSNHAEALRLHREFVEDDVITAPRQTSRRQADGSRRSFQVQRISANRVLAKLRKMSNGPLAPEYISVTCSKCPHDGPDDVPPSDDPDHLALIEQRRAELASRPRSKRA